MAEFSELRKRLEAEKEQLSQKLAEAQTSQQITERRGGGSLGKRGEEASEVLELEKRLSLEQRLRKSLDEIEHALEKYEAGTYGLCDVCGKLIEPARLEALPQANLCLKCKADQKKDAR